MNNKAFSLIEVMIALVVLAIGLLALAQMQISAVRGNLFSRYLTQASYVGQDRLETLDSLPLDSAALQAGNHNDGAVTVAGIVFNRSYTVTVNGDLRTIIYAVSWNDGVNRRISFATIRSI
jgi:type IV pilus assembly protein PilV